MKILVIEDDSVVRSLIEHVLGKQGHEVESVEYGQEGEDMSIQNGYDCIILDLALPDKNGIEVCRSIRAHQVQTPVLIVSAHKTTDSKVTGLTTGADDYLTKPFENQELLARIEAITRRSREQARGSQRFLKYGDLSMDLIKREVSVKGNKTPLTNNEFNLLAYFMQNPERVIGKDELTQKVFGVNFDTQTNFLNVYINYVRKKIKAITPKDYIQTVRKKGFILKDPSSEMVAS
ncbi:MAG: response regulator transcription factor [Balneolales bacterium]